MIHFRTLIIFVGIFISFIFGYNENKKNITSLEEEFNKIILAYNKTNSLELSNVTKSNDDKVVNGSPAKIKRYKYQVAVLAQGSLCGGTLIRYNWVVTAQHCVIGKKASDFRIRAGSKKYNKGGVLAHVDLLVKHNRFTVSTLNFDIAMLRMPHGFYKYRYPKYPIRPIRLLKTLPPDGAKCIVSGFGTLSSGGNLPNVLQKAILRKVNFKKCNSNYNNRLTKNMLCAGYFSGIRDSCQGDSGGPLVHNHRLLGVVSFGNGCATKDYPGIYASVPKLYKWIRKVLKKY